jgi:hypothetical protein
MKDHWPTDATDEERSLRIFKDTLMKYTVEKPWTFLSSEQERAAELAASKVENAHAGCGNTHPPNSRGTTPQPTRRFSPRSGGRRAEQGVRKGAADSQSAGAHTGRPRLLLPQGYVWIRACLRHAASHGRGTCTRVWSEARPSRNPIRQTGAGLRRLLHLAIQRSMSFALWYRSGK